MDALVIKPLLLHNYDKELHKKKQEFFELLSKQGMALEEKFVEIGGAGSGRNSRIS